MATVESMIVVAAPVERVYAIARDVEQFPEFMSDVQSVEILEEDGGRRVSAGLG
jgi:uncharacterized membrane protein